MSTPDIPTLLAQVVTQFREFHKSLTTLPSKSDWFRNVLVRLSDLTLREYESLIKSDGEPIITQLGLPEIY
jgi:hypothetical protein